MANAIADNVQATKAAAVIKLNGYLPVTVEAARKANPTQPKPRPRNETLNAANIKSTIAIMMSSNLKDISTFLSLP